MGQKAKLTCLGFWVSLHPKLSSVPIDVSCEHSNAIWGFRKSCAIGGQPCCIKHCESQTMHANHNT